MVCMRASGRDGQVVFITGTVGLCSLRRLKAARRTRTASNSVRWLRSASCASTSRASPAATSCCTPTLSETALHRCRREAVAVDRAVLSAPLCEPARVCSSSWLPTAAVADDDDENPVKENMEILTMMFEERRRLRHARSTAQSVRGAVICRLRRIVHSVQCITMSASLGRPPRSWRPRSCPPPLRLERGCVLCRWATVSRPKCRHEGLCIGAT